ncbi:hypothetical protein [Nocardia amamiensis]|nr:hypothetical protein [Nocardia amamiensis]
MIPTSGISGSSKVRCAAVSIIAYVRPNFLRERYGRATQAAEQ